MLPKDFLHTSPHHGTDGSDHSARDPQQNGGALKQNARAQACGVQANRREQHSQAVRRNRSRLRQLRAVRMTVE